MEPVRTAIGTIAFCLFAAQAALPQVAGSCPGGRVVSGFQLGVATAHGDALPIETVNNLGPGQEIRYAPSRLPAAWHDSGRVAVLVVPSAADYNAELSVFTENADKAATWKVPGPVAAVAFLFGPQGLNANKTRSLLQAHPELVAHLIEYAAQASRVEALVDLLVRYEQSPPGSLDLNTLLRQYSANYGIKLPAVNPSFSPDQEAAALLTAVAPPTAQNGPSPHAALTSGSTDTATALASLYFGPEIGIATDTMPLFHALHQSLFPGTQFQGAFAQSAAGGMLLCAANTAAPPQHHPVYIWMVDVPGGEPPVVRLAKAKAVTLPARQKAEVQVTCASVAQLHELRRARKWALVSAAGSVPVPVQVTAGDIADTLTLDLSHAKLAPGAYQLSALWDWTPVVVQGAFTVRPVPSLATAKLAPRTADHLVADRGLVPVDLQGADFAFVNKIELVSKDASAKPLAFTPASAAQPDQLTLTLDTSKLAPGAYDLRLLQVNGEKQDVPVAVLPPNPTLDALPLRANWGEAAQQVTLRGKHLDRIVRITSPHASWKLAPAAAQPDATERGAAVTLDPQAQVNQDLPASLFVEGLTDPIVVPDALHVLGPRPKISSLQQSLAASGTVELLPGELPVDTTVNFTFVLAHGSAEPVVKLACKQSDTQVHAVSLHPGVPSGAEELDAGGDGLFYLAATPGQIGEPGCRLQMTAGDGAGGESDPVQLGRVVRLPQIQHFTLSDQSAGPALYAGELSGDNLQLIAKTGWTADIGVPVSAVPQRSAGTPPTQTLAIVMPWPPPSPHAPLYIWLRGETKGRKTTVTP